MFPFSKLSYKSFSFERRSFVALYFFFAISSLCIFSSSTLLILAISIRLLDSSVAKADNQFLRIATSPSKFFLSASALAKFSRIIVSLRSWVATLLYNSVLLSFSLSSNFLLISLSLHFSSFFFQKYHLDLSSSSSCVGLVFFFAFDYRVVEDQLVLRGDDGTINHGQRITHVQEEHGRLLVDILLSPYC